MKRTSLFLLVCLSTFCFGHLPADFNHDKNVDFSDFAIFAAQWLSQGAGCIATVVVAPATATEEQKQLADYACDGTADDVEINAALLEAFIAGGADANTHCLGYGGTVYLLPGRYDLTDSDSDGTAILLQNRVDLIGMGNLHSVELQGGDNCGHGLYFQCDTTSYGFEKGQFTLKNLLIIMSITQSGASSCIYMEGDTPATDYLYDCIFDNLYTANSKDCGMYVEGEWASHYDNCTFEWSSGEGYKNDNSSGSVFDGCYFAHNDLQGCLMGNMSYVRFVGCSFDDNGDPDGDNTGEAGVRINHASASLSSFIGCTASNNSGDGFEINAGERFLFDSCIAYKNNWAEVSAKAGFTLRGSTVVSCAFTNCRSSYNDGSGAGGDQGGSGFYLNGHYHILRGCQSVGNNYGLYLGWSGYDMTLDVQLSANTQDIFHFGPVRNYKTRYNMTWEDTYTDVAAADTNGVKTGIVNTTPVTSFTCQPDYPRNVTVTGDGSADGNVLIQGILADGKVCDSTYSDEEITVSAGATVQGNYGWAKITKITRTTSSGSVDVGWGDKLGLSNVIRAASDVYKFVCNGSDETVPPVDDNYATVDCSAIDDGDDFVIYYKSS